MALVVGARNVGRAVAAERAAAGWRVLAVSRTAQSLERLREACPDALAVAGDARDPSVVAAAIARARDELGGLDLVVNALTAPPRGQPFGGGPLAEAPPGRLGEWIDGYLPATFEILRQSARAMAARGAGTIVQVVGPSGRRPTPGHGPFAAAQMGARGLVMTLAQEMRPRGVHVALVVANARVETDRRPPGSEPAEVMLRPEDVARAVGFLADQPGRGWTHELTVTPPGAAWTP